MPIIKRSFGAKAPPTALAIPSPLKAIAAKPSKVVANKAKVKVVKRWPHSDEQYVTVDNGVVSIRTPKDCTRWPHDFRLRVIRDYKPPATMVDKPVLARLYDPETVYTVSGRRLMFRQPVETLTNAPNKVVIIRTEIVDLTDNKAMTIQHPDPAMRIMMVYAFLRRMSFDGVASFSVYDWQPG